MRKFHLFAWWAIIIMTVIFIVAKLHYHGAIPEILSDLLVGTGAMLLMANLTIDFLADCYEKVDAKEKSK